MSEPKIRQIIPAEGWFALFTDEEDDALLEPLTSFALVEDEDGFTEVRPMSWQGSAIDFADEAEGFLGLEHLSAAALDIEDDDLP